MADAFKIADSSFLGAAARQAGPSTPLSPPVEPLTPDDVEKIGSVKDLADSFPDGDPDKDDEERQEMGKTGRFQVMLDDGSGRLYTEVMDPVSETVIHRIPPYYKTTEEREALLEKGIMI